MRISTVTVLFIIFGFGILVSSNAISQTAKYGIKPERFSMQVANDPGILSYDQIKAQKPANMRERSGGRDMITGLLVAKGIQGIINLIDNRKKKYTTEYSFSSENESFYDDISVAGAYDPVGMRFNGFSISRIGKRADGMPDTGFYAKFSIDISDDKINEIMNNGMFRLKLDSFVLHSARVKVPDNERMLNMDFEISFLSSYINDNGQMNNDVPVGRFLYSVRNAPLDESAPGYHDYYEKLVANRSECIGKSFLIPRSRGYFKNATNRAIEKCYGLGVYSIRVKVKESSQNNFVDKLIEYGSDDVLSVGNAVLQKKFGSAPARVSRAN